MNTPWTIRSIRTCGRRTATRRSEPLKPSIDRLRLLNDSRDMAVRAKDLRLHDEPVDEYMSKTRKLAAEYRESLCTLLAEMAEIQGVVAAELRRVDEHAVEDKTMPEQPADARVQAA